MIIMKKLTNKEKHYLKYILKKIEKIQKDRWEEYGDSNNPLLASHYADIDEAIEILLNKLYPESDWF